jgi:pyridinium-3,5-bisthiocarboxylic acid mononucleotide nickel chelatase
VILWLNPFSGVSGDMLLGALLDLGAPLDAVRAAVASTGLTGWELTAGRVQRAGLAACQARVQVHDGVPERRAAELLTLAQAAVPAAAGRLAAAAITALAEAEGRIHGVPAAEVHLHELGGVDTVVDTVGVAAALDALGVSAVWSAPLMLGAGVIEMRHGQFPAPAPATVALLDGVAVAGTLTGPAAGQAETVTPTGAALLRAAGCRYGPLPAMRVAGSGYGAGARDVPGRPNVLPALLGEPLHDQEPTELARDTETLIMVETTVDDVTGELLGDLPGLLLGAGALDTWITAVTGKKGRPAHVVTALCRPGQAGPVQARLLTETGSLGARRHTVQRHALPRQEVEVTVHGHRIRIKIGPHRAKPEHDDVAAAALATGLPRRVLAGQALRQLAGEAFSPLAGQAPDWPEDPA